MASPARRQLRNLAVEYLAIATDRGYLRPTGKTWPVSSRAPSIDSRRQDSTIRAPIAEIWFSSEDGGAA